MKLCKDCKYYEKAGFWKVLGLDYDKCAHPSVLWPVDGTPHLGCGQVRQDEFNSYSDYGPGPCGSEAALFEPNLKPEPEKWKKY